MKNNLNVLAAAIMSCVTVTSHAQNTNSAEVGDDIEEVVVIGTDQSRYVKKNSNALTGFELDFLELPRVVNVIPEQLVLDQKITDLNEALRNTPGVTQGDGFGGTNDDFFIRGFRRNTVYRNGFRRATNFKTNLTNIEYTQIVRGPGAITYGQVEPGGIVDIITKKPLAEQRISGEVRAGSFDDRLLLLDYSQPLSDSAGIRVVASSQEAESFRDFTDVSRDTIAISGKFQLTEALELDLAYEYRDESRPLDRGTISVNTPTGAEVINNLIDIPIERRFGEEFEIFETEFDFYEANLSYALNNDWTLKFSVAREDSTSNDLQARPLALLIFDADSDLVTDSGVFSRIPSQQETVQAFTALFDDPSDQVFLARRTDGSRDFDVEVTYLNAVATGEVETGSINHKLSLGVDYRELDSSRTFIDNPVADGVPTVFGGGGPLFDISNPVFGNLISSTSTDGFNPILVTTEDLGLFVNDYIELSDRLGLLVGIRYDEFDIGNGTSALDKQDELSPQIALNYKLAETASVFASYSEAFEPNIAVDEFAGPTVPFEPEESEQFEIGLKAEFFNGKLQTSAAIYDIGRTNVLTTVNGISELIDGQESQGLELSVVGQPIPGMNIVAGYAYTDAETSETGDTPRNVAENTFNLWGSYEWQVGSLEGFGIGSGVFFIDDRFGDSVEDLVLDSYTLVDASVWYTASVGGDSGKTVRFQLSAKNITDEEYFSASGGPLRISIGTPRTVFGSVSFDF